MPLSDGLLGPFESKDILLLHVFHPMLSPIPHASASCHRWLLLSELLAHNPTSLINHVRELVGS